MVVLCELWRGSQHLSIHISVHPGHLKSLFILHSSPNKTLMAELRQRDVQKIGTKQLDMIPLLGSTPGCPSLLWKAPECYRTRVVGHLGQLEPGYQTEKDKHSQPSGSQNPNTLSCISNNEEIYKKRFVPLANQFNNGGHLCCIIGRQIKRVRRALRNHLFLLTKWILMKNKIEFLLCLIFIKLYRY